VSLVFPVAVFLSAALLFLVEPMFARMVLPKLGGAPAVWNTCVAFYQTLLLAGYAYAHVLSTRLYLRIQVAVHLTLILAAGLVLPIGIEPTWAPGPLENPGLVVVRLLLVSLGLPFFTLAASGPLLQQWFAWRYGATRNPYRLYAASNAGSLLALVAYPSAVEPLVGLREQSLFWTAGFAALLLLAAACGVATWTAAPGRRPRAQAASGDDAPSWTMRLRWLGLAFVPSSLMLSVTTFISTDLAAIPLLWVVPLALYLATLIAAFADRQIVSRATTDRLFPIALLAVVALLVAERVIPVSFAIVSHMGVFLLAAWACHMRLASIRPGISRLTQFYLWIAAGGALGGVFNTFLAPALFVTPIEYPVVAIVACVLFADDLTWPQTLAARARVVVTAAAPAFAVLVLTPLSHRLGWEFLPEATVVRSAWAAAPALVLAFWLRRSPLRLGAALALILMAGAWVRIDDRVTLHIERSFFGIYRVTDAGFTHVLMSGTTNHGAQAVNPDLRCEPLSYYSRGGPVGQVMATLQQRLPALRMAVVGLGTASMASYVRPGDTLTFFEINPAVERLARNPEYFTYLRDCAPDARIVLGDARLALEQLPEESFDFVAIDAFSSDAIPVHLMTTEAVALYFRTLTPAGILALHISNRYLDLAPVVAAIVEARGYGAAIQHHRPDPGLEGWRASASTWVVIARDGADLAPAVASGRWREPVATPGPLWTDDYSNVVRIIQTRQPTQPQGEQPPQEGDDP
jgi:hypothetical protein